MYFFRMYGRIFAHVFIAVLVLGLGGCLDSGKEAEVSPEDDERFEEMLEGEPYDAMLNIQDQLHRLYGYDEGKASGAHKVFMLIDNVMREVNNGGFRQFFGNSSGRYANETLAALESIGSTHISELMREALSYFPNGQLPTDPIAREAMIEKVATKEVQEAWSALDERFYAVDEEWLDELLIEYVRKHKKEFIF